MMHAQLFPAFIAALVAEGVKAEQIEDAVGRVVHLQPGESFAPNPLHRAFANEQSKLLEKALS